LDWYFYASILLLVIGAFVSLKQKSDLEKQFEIADEEIEEQLTIYEEWNNGYKKSLIPIYRGKAFKCSVKFLNCEYPS